MELQYIDSPQFKEQAQGKRVLIRFDFNVPMIDGEISDTTRIDLSLETIRQVLKSSPRQVVMMSHLGRPQGENKEKFSLKKVAEVLCERLGEDIFFVEDATDIDAHRMLSICKERFILLENLRFHSEEKNNDHEFARTIGRLGDVYVNDAFGCCHRAHASVNAIAKLFKHKAYAGQTIKRELGALGYILNHPHRPFIGVIGGAKVTDKIQVIKKLLPHVDTLLIGGAMAYPFLKHLDQEVGKSLCQDEDVVAAREIMALESAHKIKLPCDHTFGKDLHGKANGTDQTIPEDMMGLDIGPRTIQLFTDCLQEAKTIFWNGPMGYFENPAFATGSLKVAETIAHSQAYSVVGGGDSLSAVKKAQVNEQVSHLCSGGGAAMEYLYNPNLPGLHALRFQ